MRTPFTDVVSVPIPFAGLDGSLLIALARKMPICNATRSMGYGTRRVESALPAGFRASQKSTVIFPGTCQHCCKGPPTTHQLAGFFSDRFRRGWRAAAQKVIVAISEGPVDNETTNRPPKPPLSNTIHRWRDTTQFGGR